MLNDATVVLKLSQLLAEVTLQRDQLRVQLQQVSDELARLRSVTNGTVRAFRDVEVGQVIFHPEESGSRWTDAEG